MLLLIAALTRLTHQENTSLYWYFAFIYHCGTTALWL